MSITIIISVLCKEKHDSEAFLGILTRMRKRGIEGHSRRYEIVSGKEEDNFCDIDPIRDIGHVERASGPKSSIHVEMGFALRSGRTIPVTLCYSGPEFWGSSVKENGPLILLFSLNDIARPLYDSGGVDQENALCKPLLTTACVQDGEDLFFTACGVLDGSESHSCVKHGLMYADYGFVSPLNCAMVYHQDSSQFLTDFPRMYCVHHFGTNPISALDPDLDLWQLAPIGAETNRPGRLSGDLNRDVYEPDGDQVISFLDRLEATGLASLKNTTVDCMKNWFRHADIAKWQIHYHELPNDSFALTTYPLFTLWRAYAEFYHAMTAKS